MDYTVKEDIIEYIFDRIKRIFKPSEFLQSNILLYCVILLLVLKITVVSISINFPQNLFFADITKSALENFINQTRQSLGLQILSENKKLTQAAQLKAENMVQNQYFDHTSPSGIVPWFWFLKAGYNYKYAGENLAIGFYDSKEVYNAWLNSPSHRANILNPNYKEVGTAVLSGFGQNDAIIVVQEFGTQLPSDASAKKDNLKPVVTQLKPVVEAAKPVAVADTKTLTPNTDEKVLSQATESQNSLKSPDGTGANKPSLKLLNFVLYNYFGLLQNVIYGISLVVIGILFALIFFDFNIGKKNFKSELIFRTVLIAVLLSAAVLLNKEIIVTLIPHQIVI